MGSEKTVTSGIPIPNWVKSKLNDRYNLDDSAFSPPTDEDGFLFIPYPKPSNTTPLANDDSKFVSITHALHMNSHNENNSRRVQFGGFGQHTLPCQKYMGGGMCDPTSTASKVNKSFGTDDGFKGEAAQCGKSIVAVAEQMVRSNQLYNGRSSDDTFTGTMGLPNEKYLQTRRNSRSLPTSPLTSRKKNPFFTPPILASVDKSEPLFDSAVSKNKIRDLSPSTGGMRAKPTELREINFWSPTSM